MPETPVFLYVPSPVRTGRRGLLRFSLLTRLCNLAWWSGAAASSGALGLASGLVLAAANVRAFLCCVNSHVRKTHPLKL